MSRTIRTAGLAALTLLLAASALPARELSLVERVTAQKAIEQVYWSHRIWPKENPGPKPALAAVMSDQAIRTKVDDYLRKSNALERFWQRPVTAEQLQAELDRMAKNTRDGATLQELFGALGNDPFVIAETLGRQTLVERLIRNWYANDIRFHGAVKAKADAALAACSNVDCMKAMGGEYRETTWERRAASEVAKRDPRPDRAVCLDADEWADHRSSLAAKLGTTAELLPVRRLSGLEETPEAFVVTAVLSQREGELETASVAWGKPPFDIWWRNQHGNLEAGVAPSSVGFSLPHTPSTLCENDTWSPTRLDVPEARRDHTAIWTGVEMIVWGGSDRTGGFLSVPFNTGGRYNPATDTWSLTATEPNVPAARFSHSAVWTGTEMIVWGGYDNDTNFDSGGRYNPAADAWTATSTTNAPSGRRHHTAVWMGTEMIVWGGIDSVTNLNTGGRYNPSAGTWTATQLTNAPSGRSRHTAVWTGTELIVWGGYDGVHLNTGGRYNAALNQWLSTPLPAMNARSGHSAVWTGAVMIVWGGQGTVYYNDGARFNPSTSAWSATSTAGVPSARSFHTAVWTGTEMIVWGAAGGSSYVQTGGRYNPNANAWSATSVGANVPTARGGHTAVWTGTDMVVWGGELWSSSLKLNSGGRYSPSTNTWTPTSTATSVPTAREQPSSVWTGTEMIVWGGNNSVVNLNTGGRYLAATDSWVPTSTGVNVPQARDRHAAVWTGTEMIVWGGGFYNGVDNFVNTGGRYNPLTDGWAPTSTGTNVPTARSGHTAAWTGTEMIVWGGGAFNIVNTGGRYNPLTDNWALTSTGTNVPTARASHTAVWTGTAMIVWGGTDGANDFSTGGRYSPATDSWVATSVGGNVPAGRFLHTAVWTGTEVIVWGGVGASYFNSGGRYDPLADSWAATSPGFGVPLARIRHTAVWSGAEMIVWGGELQSINSYLNSGGRYNPVTDGWTATALGADVPSSRARHAAVWTGTEMIVWGGAPNAASGGRYCACPNGGIVYRDVDGDGFGNPGVSTSTCDGSLPSGYVADATDCNDASAAVRPGASEQCDGLDNNCDAVVPSSEVDVDGDGVRICGGDCNDGNPYVYSGASEINDGIDNQCPGNSGYGSRDEIGGVFGFLTVNNKTLMSWPAQAGASGYTVARSPYRDLHAGCTLTATGAASLIDLEVPIPGGSFYYLVRSADPNAGSWGARSSGVERTVCAACDNSGNACDDGNACTAGDACSGTVCQPGSSRSCDDSQVCTDDSCNPATGCAHVNTTAPCSDGDACTTGDTCGSGTCHGGPAPNCDDGNPCTDDSCNPALGCVHVNNTSACSDGSVCTTGDGCSGGACVPGAALDCDDANPCTTDSCNPVTGCVHVNNTAACDDGNACTTGDVCGGGVCAGTIPPGAGHLVISQIQTSGDGGSPLSDEYIEIYNPTAFPVSLSGWSLQSVISTFPSLSVSKHSFFTGTVPAHGWFLVARSQYNGAVARDSTYSTFTLPESGNSVFLVNSQTDASSCTALSIVDKVAYGNGTCGEGAAASAPTASNSILRRPGGACGNGTDTNSNSADFVIQSPSTPRNSTSLPQP